MKSSSRKHPSRQLPEGETRTAVKAYAQLAGEVVYAWTDLQKSMAHTFLKLFPDDSSYIAMVIWNAAVADSTQRDLLKVLVDEGIGVKSRQRNALLWAIKRTNDLAKFRNDVVHGTVGYRIVGKRLETRLAYFGNPLGRIMRHQEHPRLPIFLRILRGDLLQLSDYVMEVSRIVGEKGTQGPLPRKPRLRLLPHPQRKRSRNRKNGPKPSSQPPASGG